MPKSFSTVIPATELYEKYQDSLPESTSVPSKSTPVKVVPTVVVQAEETEKALASVE